MVTGGVPRPGTACIHHGIRHGGLLAIELRAAGRLELKSGLRYASLGSALLAVFSLLYAAIAVARVPAGQGRGDNVIPPLLSVYHTAVSTGFYDPDSGSKDTRLPRARWNNIAELQPQAAGGSHGAAPISRFPKAPNHHLEEFCWILGPIKFLFVASIETTCSTSMRLSVLGHRNLAAASQWVRHNAVRWVSWEAASGAPTSESSIVLRHAGYEVSISVFAPAAF